MVKMDLGELHNRIDSPGSVFLETVPRAGYPGKTILFESPLDVIRCIHGSNVRESLARIDDEVRRGRFVAGYLTYEAGAALNDIDYDHDPARPEDLLWLGVYEKQTIIDRDEVSNRSFGSGPHQQPRISGSFSLGENSYRTSIERIKRHIREGDVYQINFTAPFSFNTQLTALELYASLRQRQRVDYAALINTGTRRILSLSPELFFSRSGSTLTSRPMKGTASRGANEEEDHEIRLALQADSKNRAENLMIVDLIRNDLSRVCIPGSVMVSDLFTAETYETVIQMTSTVHGDLKPGTSYREIFEAIYPCGSITGAPKIRAMEIINEVEKGPRGVYCGCVGYISPNDEAVFNVAIRTIDLDGESGTMGIGSGIVWDSDAASEFSECLLKAKFLTDAAEPETRDPFVIIETMRWDGGIALLKKHLERLKRTATRFGYPCDQAYLLDELNSITSTLATPSKIRIELDRQGRFAIQTSELAEDLRVLRVKISDRSVSSTDVFRRFKTSKRKLYTSEYELAAADGFDEVLFLNEHGDVAEGSRTNVVVEIEGRLYTPPVEAGALPGVMRQSLLESSAKYEEKNLKIEDLLNCDRLYICNAVWGLREARLYPLIPSST